MIVAGIDVGAKGALAILDKQIICKEYNEISLSGYIKLLKKHRPDLVVVEKVGAMPKQGVVSMFNFGVRLGEIEGMLQTLEIPYLLISPKVWQKALNITPKSDKKAIASVVSKLYPNVDLYTPRGRLKDGVSDALALATYGKVIYEK